MQQQLEDARRDFADELEKQRQATALVDVNVLRSGITIKRC
ncbi:hypothetical protein AAKU67_003247 [Oxalobacteraceae bacterium GrIS 2.11]